MILYIIALYLDLDFDLDHDYYGERGQGAEDQPGAEIRGHGGQGRGHKGGCHAFLVCNSLVVIDW